MISCDDENPGKSRRCSVHLLIADSFVYVMLEFSFSFLFSSFCPAHSEAIHWGLFPTQCPKLVSSRRSKSCLEWRSATTVEVSEQHQHFLFWWGYNRGVKEAWVALEVTLLNRALKSVESVSLLSKVARPDQLCQLDILGVALACCYSWSRARWCSANQARTEFVGIALAHFKSWNFC